MFGGSDDDDLALWREELVEALPPIADDRRAAGGRLEQAPGRTPAERGHWLPRHVECRSGRGVEFWMLVCSYMAPKKYIARPREVGGVLCAANDETVLRPTPRGLDEQCFEGRLTV